MLVTAELLLAQIEEIQSISGSRPQLAAPVLINRDDGVIVKAIRVGFIVLKNWRQPLAKGISRPKVLGGDASWPEVDITKAGEFTPSVILCITGLCSMRFLL